MRPADRKAFKDLLTHVMAFYRQDVSTFALSVWWQACEPFDMEQVSKALTAHAMDPERGQFAPKPADLVRVLQGTHTDRSLVAWGKVYGAMQSVGAYQSVAFDDPAIHLAVEDIGGWVALCRALTDELSFWQKRFSDSYKVHAKRPETPYPARLIGESEQQNQSQKLTVTQQALVSDKTVLVGDPDRAMAVVKGGGLQRRHGMTVIADLVPQQQRLSNAA